MRSFRPEDTAPCYRIGHIEDDLRKGLSEGKKMIIGHIDFSNLQKVEIPEEYKLLTMFRHPAERIISTHLHFQKNDNPDYSTWKGGKVNFEEFMNSEFANNWYVQLLSGKKGLVPSDSDEDELLQLAQNNFKRLDWVGVSERFEDSIFSLSIFMGRRLKNPGKFNEGGQPDEHFRLRGMYRPQLLVKNTSDILIYQMALKELDQQLNKVRFKNIRRGIFNLVSG